MVLEPFAQHLVLGEQVAEFFQLRRSGQLSPDKQIGGLDEVAVFRQILNPILMTTNALR